MTNINQNEHIQSRLNKYEEITWTLNESSFRNRSKYRKDFLRINPITLTMALIVKLKKSDIGIFLEHFNKQQLQDTYLNTNKYDITMYNYKFITKDERDILNLNNNVTNEFMNMILHGVNYTNLIDWNFLYKNFYIIRLSNLYINQLDDGLIKFRNVKLVVLSGNWLQEVFGNYLPRSMQFLELFCNEIEDVTSLTLNAPKNIVHLGLGRNKLTNGCNCHLLPKCNSYQQLRSIDLCHNDIYNLHDILQDLQGLKHLSCLSLHGNPCYVCKAYKSVVLNYLPKLIFLDNVELLFKDRETIKYETDEVYEGELIFTCHRIMGLEQPKKEKGIIQCYQFELQMPLLEDLNVTQDYSDSEEESKDKKKNKKKEKGKKNKKSDKKSKKSAKQSIYDKPDEYAEEKLKRLINTSIKSQRFNWSKNIQLPEEFLTISSPENNLTTIRDTLGTRVNVKLIYYKILPPPKKIKGKNPKEKKGKKGKKSKGSKKGKDKKNAKGKKDKSKGSEQKNEKRVIIPREQIVKKITIANFYCHLHYINWSDKTIDYYWSDHPDIKTIAVPIEGSLKDVVYVERKKGKGKEKSKDKGKSKSKKKQEEKLEKVPSKEFIPHRLTIEIGFGLKRNYCTV